MKIRFETETCSRCNGSGKHSFCERFRDICFKCSGSGITLTKRGIAAKAYLDRLCTVPAGQIRIGDRIASHGMTNGGASYNYVGTVSGIRTREATRTTVKTKRDDGSLTVSYSVEYNETEGFSTIRSSGATVERSGEAGTFIEKFTEYCIEVTSKYGVASQTLSGEVRTYPTDNEAKILEALAYQETLTKTGTIKKNKKTK